MRRGRRKGASKDKVFGCDLLEHLAASSQEIPQVLRCCSEFIEEHGIVDGIYRLSGVSSNIQKLRSEFDGEGTPDLCKDVYLQDIHCISSLCKAYFRELPNPLLTYQLYDKFADAVAVQLEEERLVKIKEVLKDLPPPHYRTLEFLMRHLVKMSTFASQTNMHARNLAIVWAPNLLRSKDIEASGFNGTAAFMEVRVQSIVVEFILTHVTQLFPIPGQPSERRKSLPSPSVMANQEDPFFRTVPLQLPSALSLGDGPPPMRPYHSIIESTDKRKGSLKGRKWKSIFNLGGRLQDPRRKNKVTCKDKEKVGLRPAKSMDSLSSVPYSHEGGRAHPSPSPPLGREAGSSGGVLGGAGSAYAVTYRRGGGASVSVVSGGGTQGTYSRLDSGGGSTADGLPPPRSPGLSSRAERRAGIHISGPFSVTVPLHITSGLALGVLQGGAQREEGGAQREEGGAQREEGGAQREEGWAQREEGRTEKEVDGAENDEGGAQREEGGAQREEGGTQREEGRKVWKEVDGAEMERGSVKIEVCISEKEESREWREGEKHREERKEGAVDRKKGENRIVEGEDRCSDAVGIKESLSVEEEEEPAASPGTVQQGLEEEEPDYMDMRAGMVQIPLDEQLPLDFQDTFGFLDLMDNSTYNQVNEFSVEPPCYEEEEDDEEQSGYLGGAPSAQSPQWSAPPIQTYRSVTFDPNSRACKSHSLPYKSQSFLPATSFSSSEDEDDGSEEEDGSDEENDRFFCSLPDSLQFQALIQRDMARDANAGDLSSPDLHAPRQERTGTNGHGSSDSSTCEGLQMELESSLPLMDMDRAGGEGGFSDREAQASQWAQTDKMEDRPTHTEEHTKMEDRPTHTEEHTKMKDRPPHTEEHTKMEDRPTHTEEHTKMEDRPTYTEEHTKMEDRPTYTEEHTKMEDRPTYTEEHTKMEDRPTHTEEHTKMEERPTHTEEHTKMEDRPTHTEEHTKMEDRPTVTEEHTKMEDRSPHTEEHTKMEDRPTHTEEHTKMKDRLTHTEEHTKMEDRPPHTEEHTKNEDRPPYTEEHTKMEDKPTLSEERTKMEDRPPHTEEHTKMEDRPTLSEEYTNTARAERDHVATWTDTPGLGCREAEASLTESEEEYEEDENPSVLEHSERDCPAEPRISEHCERDCPAEPRISEHCERDCPAEPRISENCERDCPAEPRISENCERDCPAEPRISEHCERDCPADRPAQHTDSGLIGTAGGCQGNTVDQGGCHGDLANRTTQVAEPSLCLLEPQFFLIEPPLSEPQLVYDSHLEQVTIPEEKPPTSVDELEQTCWEGGGQIEREQAREGVGEKNTEDKEEKEKRKEEVGEKLERGVSSGAPGDVNRVRDLRKERGSKEERGGSEQLSHGVGERAAPAPQEDKELQRRSVKEGGERGEAAAGEMGPGVGRALVRSKQTLPKLHQAKAVPVVPPKPQTCKLAALNLRQQLHQRELERGKEGEAERAREERRETEGQGDGKKASRRDGEEEEEQYKAAKDGGTEIQLERWGEDGRDVEKEVKRSSGNSICFDEAVARATEKREREKERGRDGERERRREGEMERRKEEEMERRREGEMEKGRDGERERRREGEREREGGREGEREK